MDKKYPTYAEAKAEAVRNGTEIRRQMKIQSRRFATLFLLLGLAGCAISFWVLYGQGL
ncbi:hypothetical protein NIM87_05930 [Devosia sp. XJ19-1]|uniref:Uncharacterized protein n=1 Tax=Devosia ureilytica TaxID=2952754 RepID=A0A9Q4AN16_9HYPH|nr:hypothetical protein [Devosia ureilytica]MCP8883031.1 hypothetical protein [Devosia ureilytica]MCP8886601.1 hypothetical protein [Devosia ureilytica]